jgi:hypothetical protein
LRANRIALIALIVAAACADPSDSVGPASTVKAVSSTSITAVAGSTLPDPLRVQVLDARDHEVQGAKVQFAIVQGDGSLDTHLAITDADGIAEVHWTLSKVAGENQVVASTFGPQSIATFNATGIPGPAVGLSIYPRVLRFPSGTTTGQVAAAIVDQFGNPIAGAATYASKDPSAATVVDATGAVTRAAPAAQSASTYVVATSGSFRDSSLVILLSNTDTPCTGITATANLAAGDVTTTGFDDGGICVPAGTADREYAIVPFFDSSVPSAQTFTTITGFGVSVASGSLSALRPVSTAPMTTLESQRLESRARFDAGLRSAERIGMSSRALGARTWYRQQASRRATRSAGVPAVGDRTTFNTNPDSFCTDPVNVTARVVAVTTHSIVYADVDNPAGGFTDAEMAGYGTTFDTLAYPTDVANFGAPTDIDENGRVIILFTKEVGKNNPGILGYEYSRDLLPKVGTYGSCPGSNVAEMFYMRVPTDAAARAFVAANTPATLAHEFQHMINAGRRLYVNTSAAPNEEVWLNEGLSHVAEELAFFHSTGLSPRQNLASVPAAQQTALSELMDQNFARYKSYFMTSPSSESPVGTDDADDDLATRGAAWSMLRYLADQKFAVNEAAFWSSLVNANTTGMENLSLQVGPTLRDMFRDWTLSNWLDDLVATAPQYQQPTWNIRKINGTYLPSYAALTSSTSPANGTSQIPLRALSAAFVRFGVGAGKEAYVRASGFNNLPLPAGVKLALVRTK